MQLRMVLLTVYLVGLLNIAAVALGLSSGSVRTAGLWLVVAGVGVLVMAVRAVAAQRGGRWWRGAAHGPQPQQRGGQQRKQQEHARRRDLQMANGDAGYGWAATATEIRVGASAQRQAGTTAAASGDIKSAYAAARRAVQQHGFVPYAPISQYTHVHVRVGGMQPEQLVPGWQAELEKRFAEQGWCLLNTAVRRGSTRLSLTLANLHAYQAAAAGPAAADGHAGAEPTQRAAVGGRGGLEEVPLSEDPDVVADLIGGPEELAASLGMRRKDLKPGYSFTVQAVVDNGRRHRARYTYTCQHDGTWLRDLLDDSSGLAEGTDCGALDAGEPCGSSRASRAPGHGLWAGLDGRDGGRSSDQSPMTGFEGQQPSDGGDAQLRDSDGESGARAGAAQRWALCAPCVLLGTPEPRGASHRPGGGCMGVQRYEAEVVITWGFGGSSNGGGGGRGGALVGIKAPSAGAPWNDADLAFRVRQLGWPCEPAEFKVRQELVQQGDGDGATWGPDEGPAVGSGSGSRAGTGRGQAWNLTVWDEPSPGMEDLPTVALPPRALRAGHGGEGDGEGGGVAPIGATPVLRLVDLSAWRGEELLTARMLLLVPRGPADPRDGNGRDAIPRWAAELQELLRAHPPEVAQHIMVDMGLLLSGAFEGPTAEPAAVRRVGAPAAAVEAAQGPGGAAAGSVGGGSLRSSSQLVLLLDLGAGLLSLVLRHGYCTLAGLLWISLERLGFGAEELLLHGAGATQGVGLPLLHAAVSSGEPRAVGLVLSWYAAAGLPEPWLQPVRILGSPAALTPLVLAAAASPSGALLSYILRSHSQALSAWRVPFNGTNGRSVAAAAGLWAVVAEGDVRAAVVPAAAAVAAVSRRVLRLRLLPALMRAASGNCARGAMRVLMSDSGKGAALAGASASVTSGSPSAVDCTATSATAVSKHFGAVSCDRCADLDVFVAQRTRTQMVGFQLAIVTYQLLAQLKALSRSIKAACHLEAAMAAAAAAASPHGWAWPCLARTTGRCVAGRLWWTILEVALAAAMASPLGVRHHALCCVAATASRCLFQGFEGVLLPPSQMRATGLQMALAHSLFVLATACCYQAPCRLNLLLRFAEGLAAARMYVRYGVTTKLWLAVVQAMAMEAVGWLLSVALRSRARAALRRRRGLGPPQQPRGRQPRPQQQKLAQQHTKRTQ